jgi:hypothetical protein
MAFALTTASTISCPHAGSVTPTSPAKLSVGGNQVLLTNQVSSWSILLCSVPTNPASTPPTKQCLKVVSETGGDATKLTVGGVAVLLDSAVAQSDGAPPAPPAGPPVAVTAGQSKLQAV